MTKGSNRVLVLKDSSNLIPETIHAYLHTVLPLRSGVPIPLSAQNDPPGCLNVPL